MLRNVRTIRNFASTAGLGIFCIVASGCLVVSGKHLDESGTRVTSSTLNQISPGQTTETWLVATLGEPTDRTVVSSYPDVAILKYQHVETKSSGGAVFLIFAGGSESTRKTMTYFEVTDGVVTRYWTEGVRR